MYLRSHALTDARRDSLQREVRADAARDSVERARAYAAALGYDDVRLLALFEDGLRPNVSGGVGGAGTSVRGAPPAPGGAKAFEMRPDDIVVTAAVTADFEVV
ncbi:SIMPL domain-containing protein [Oerskovia sp. NPDC060338]|uniref:SIMPL domain-containing protein n=1 Tax=Oerskovia sp. NPDC060338 TaxID=3347100 RepID=UPI003664B7B7